MRNAFSLDSKREVDVALCILRFSVLKKFGILKSSTKIHTADLHHIITGNDLETKISRTFLDFYHLGHEFCVISDQFHARHAGHAKPNATGFTIGMPGMPNPVQLASRSACRACQTQCNWLHDRHAGNAKPNEQTSVLPVTIPETIAGLISVPFPFSLLK